MKKFKIFFIWFLFSAINLSVVNLELVAVEPEFAVSKKEIVLVRDVPANEKPPKNFRTADTIRSFLEGEKSVITAEGLIGLRASGSAQPSERGLSWLKKRLGDDLIIMDLRQESHGFINGAAVTWYAPNNWINFGKTHEEALLDESTRLDALAQDNRVHLYDGKAIKHGIKDSGEVFEIKQVRSEQQLNKQNSIRYLRLMVPDHMRPSDEEVDRFIAFVRTLDDKDWLHFHCRAGMGRTTTFFVMYDMLRNADKASLEDIVARHATATPNYDLFKHREGPRKNGYLDRTNFIRRFYGYAKAFKRGENANWTEWLRKHERKIPGKTDK